MTEQIKICRLNRSDADLLATSDAFDHQVIPEQLEAFLINDNHEIVAALDGDRVIGFASGVVLLHPDKSPIFFIAEVGVNEGYRRQGVGFRLVEQIISVARTIGCRGIWVATKSDNKAARALYNSLDARETNDISVYDWDGAMDD